MTKNTERDEFLEREFNFDKAVPNPYAKELKKQKPLTNEQIKMLDELETRPIVFDEDCPELTEEQLAEFHRIS